MRDVAATTRLRVTMTRWTGEDDTIGWVVHPFLGTNAGPTRPAWETFHLLEGADSLALHPLSMAPRSRLGPEDDEDHVLAIAGAAQDLVQMLLWEQGQDTTWPPCPANPDRHPLRLDRRFGWSGTADAPVREHDTGAVWVCRTGGWQVPVGQLA